MKEATWNEVYIGVGTDAGMQRLHVLTILKDGFGLHFSVQVYRVVQMEFTDKKFILVQYKEALSKLTHLLLPQFMFSEAFKF